MPVVAIGGAVMSFFGASAATVAASTVIAGAIGGAIVGAVVGGVTSAISGGNIGKGVMMGAVTGAVTGAFAGWMQAPSTSATGATTATTETTKVAATSSGQPTWNTVNTPQGDLTLMEPGPNITGAAPATTAGTTATPVLTEAERISAATNQATIKAAENQATITAWTEMGKGIFGAIGAGEEAKEKAKAERESLLLQNEMAKENKISLTGAMGDYKPQTPTVTGFNKVPVQSTSPGIPMTTVQPVAPTALAAKPTAVSSVAPTQPTSNVSALQNKPQGVL